MDSFPYDTTHPTRKDNSNLSLTSAEVITDTTLAPEGIQVIFNLLAVDDQVAQDRVCEASNTMPVIPQAR